MGRHAALADYRHYVLPHSSRVFATLAEYGVPMTHFGVGTAELLGAMSDGGPDGRRRGLADIADRCGRPGQGPARRCRATSIQWCCRPGWPVVERAARAVVDDGRRAVDAGAAGHVFNLGHGVPPQTDPGVLTELVALVHSYDLVLHCGRRHFGIDRSVPVARGRRSCRS